MNKKARALDMFNTNFANPHGLQNVLNFSTARDIITLSVYCWDFEKCRIIANTEIYTALIYANKELNDCLEIMWKNTNKLLNEGWEGIKTGQTITAGSCLSSFR